MMKLLAMALIWMIIGIPYVLMKIGVVLLFPKHRGYHFHLWKRGMHSGGHYSQYAFNIRGRK